MIFGLLNKVILLILLITGRLFIGIDVRLWRPNSILSILGYKPVAAMPQIEQALFNSLILLILLITGRLFLG